MTSLTITIPVPSPKLSPNARVHWRVKATLVKAARLTARLISREALGSNPAPLWDKCSARVVAYFPTMKRPDPDNLIARLKATFDGIADAQIIMDDANLWPERPVILKDAKNPRIEITITPENNQ